MIMNSIQKESTKEKVLFRKEVYDNKRNKNYGSVFINMPVQYMVLTLAVAVFIFCIFLFIFMGEFSEKFIVSGYLESTKSVARVYAKKNGVISRQYIRQGDEVKRGDKLFLIDTSYEGLDKKSQDDVLSNLEKKKNSIDNEQIYKKRQLSELKQLLEKKYISLIAYNKMREELIVLEHQKNTINREIIEYKKDASYLIRAPIDGIISNVIYEEGQYPNLTKPLVKILPNHTDLVAKLFIPVRQSGFLALKSKVIIRYDAYPYARFGVSNAFINEISRSILTDQEEEKPIRIGQPYYKVTAKLDKQFVAVYGKEKKIRHGMTLSAVIVGSKKKIWQWILDPVYSFYGSVSL